MSENTYWTLFWAIIVSGVLGLVVLTRGCALEVEKQEIELHKEAMAKGCVYIEGSREITFCPKGVK